jgi:hypothetical protein
MQGRVIGFVLGANHDVRKAAPTKLLKYWHFDRQIIIVRVRWIR